MDLDKSQKDPIACLQRRSSTAANKQSTPQQPSSFQSRSNSSSTNKLSTLATNQNYQHTQELSSGSASTALPLVFAMDSTYNYVSPDSVMAPNAFGDDEDFMAYDPTFLPATTLPNEALPFLADGTHFTMPVDFPMASLDTPPLSGFDGYLAGNLDFDENLFNTVGDLSWAADMYNQNFATGMDTFDVPAPPSTASESQGFSPAEMLLPFTPPEVPTAGYSTMSSPSSANPSPPSSHQPTDRKPSSTGPKRQLRKLIKPETCPVCGKGHAQLRERDRHIITQHYDEAVRMGLNVDRPQCSLCDQTFRRKDHLTRHMKRRHGW
jgi:hypothetical protein